ncbi:MAG: cell division FtsZ family protein [Bacteroidales bacterium]|jgi:cell division protein FtsZ|nr:cell division FtsZ family protein [Bacteroidales bacterium]
MEIAQDILQFESPKENNNFIKAIGVGGGGTNAINHMFNTGIEMVDFFVCNTDQKSLDASPVKNKIKIGRDGLGAGNCPEKAREAALLAETEIKSMISNNTQMLFIAAGMGGGTGTGASPVIAKFAKEIEFTDDRGEKLDDEILVVAVVTLPFNFEGKRRKEQAEQGIRALKEANVDSLIIVNSNKIRSKGNMPITKMFPMVDDILLKATKSIATVITSNAYVVVDFRDVQSVMSHSGVALMGMGSACGSGEERAMEAIRQATDSDLLNDCDIKGTKNVLISITTSSEEEYAITMDEIHLMVDYISAQTANESDEVIWGLKYDDTLKDKIEITLIATGFEEKEIYDPVNRTIGSVSDGLSPAKKMIEKKEEKKEEPQKGFPLPHLITDKDVSVMPKSLVENNTPINTNVISPINISNNNSNENTPKVPTIIGTLGMELKKTEIIEANKEEIQLNEVGTINLVNEPEIRPKPREIQHTNPLYEEDVEKQLEQRKKRLSELNAKLKNNAGIYDVIKTPAYEQAGYKKDIYPEKHSSSSEISDTSINKEEGLSNDKNTFLHTNVD